MKSANENLKIQHETDHSKYLRVIEEKANELNDMINIKASKRETQLIEAEIKYELTEKFEEMKPMIDENTEKIGNIVGNLQRKDSDIKRLSKQLEEVMKGNDTPTERVSDKMEEKLDDIVRELGNKACKASVSEIVKQNKKNIDAVKGDLVADLDGLLSTYSSMNKKQEMLESKTEDHAKEINQTLSLSEQRLEQQH